MSTINKLSDTYLYSQYEKYGEIIFKAIMNSEAIDTKSPEFDDILRDIKRQNVGVAITDVATSKNIILLIDAQLPKYFKVFSAKDLKGDKKSTKVYVDCSGVIVNTNGKYICKNLDMLIAYLINAMTTLIYTADPARITTNGDIIKSGAGAYAAMFTHIVDYVYKISITPEVKAKCKYLTARFFVEHLLGKDYTDSVAAIVRKIAGVGERDEDILNIQIAADSFETLPKFIECLAHILKINITTDVVVDKWMFLFGPGTVFGVEFFPAFASMLTDTYSGAYINNQKTIEKVAARDMVDFTKTIFRIGSGVLNASR